MSPPPATPAPAAPPPAAPPAAAAIPAGFPIGRIRADARPGRTLAVAAVVAAALLGGLEAAVRARGWEPAVSDGTAPQAWRRGRARAAGPDAAVLPGPPRVQSNFDPDVPAAPAGRS